MKRISYKLKARIWLYPGENASWHFVTIQKKESAEITNQYKAFKKGWGSLPVTATIGTTTWNTSIFPDSKSGTYLLPIKAKTRKEEGLFEGDTVPVILKIRL